MKRCTRCEIEKPSTDFNRDRNMKDGLTYKCKACATAATKEWANKNKEHLREYNKAQYALNPEKKKAAAKRYRELNIERSRENNKIWRQKNQDYVRNKFLSTRYNLSIETYEAMFKSQNGGCKVCGKQNLDGKRLFVDHDHKTGTVRGLLCHHCNAGMGHFFDDPSLLESAINYLKDHNSKETV